MSDRIDAGRRRSLAVLGLTANAALLGGCASMMGPPRVHFSESELVALTFAVVVINSWNRLAVSFRAPAGTYQPQMAAHA